MKKSNRAAGRGKRPQPPNNNPGILATAEALMNDQLKCLTDKQAFFFDRDGTLTLGDEVLPGAAELLVRLRQLGKKIFILTNNSSRTPEEHWRRFRAIGLEVELQEVLVSIEPAVAHLRDIGTKRVFWVANRGVSDFLTAAGFTFDEESPEALLLTFDDGPIDDKLRQLTELAAQGIPYFATHDDLVCPMPGGCVPDAGTFINTVELASHRRPDKIFGKPDTAMIDCALQRHGLTSKDAVIVGDRLYTDILLAKNSGATSILVLSGETSREDYENQPIRSDIVVSGVADLLEHL